MSNVKLQASASGTGTVTIAPPVTNSDLTINLPANSGTVPTIASVVNNGVVYTNSTGAITSSSALTFDGTSFTNKPATGGAYSRTESTQFANFVQHFALSGNTGVEYKTAYRFVDTDVGELMRLTSTGLGVGTSTPGSKLEVAGQIAAKYANPDVAGIVLQATTGTNAAAMKFTNTGGNGYVGLDSSSGNRIGGGAYSLNIWHEAAYPIAFGTNNTLRATLDSSGNLGLGVTPSAWGSFTALQVKNGSVASTGNDFNLMSNAYYDGTNYRRISANGVGRQYFNTDGSIAWFQAGSSTAGSTISFTQAMTLDASGNLGVGTTTIGSRVTIGDPGTGLAFSNAASGNFNIGLLAGTGSALAYVYQRANSDLLFGTNNTERARITSGGDLLVGTTSGSWHTIRKDASDAYALGVVNGTSGNPYGLQITYPNKAPNTVNELFISAVDSSAARFQVRANGGIANYQANDSNLSDRREKTNFAPAKSYLDTICAIPVQTFNYIDQSENDPGLTLGVVAQDVQAVAPELVSESNWGTKEEPKMRLSIYQTDLQYALMKALQELKAEFDAYKATHP